MATTLGNIQTALAYRLGEDSAPTNATEKARRTAFIVDAYKKVFNKRPWWWTEESTTFDTVANQEAYTTVGGFPSDYREPIELRIDDILYTYVPESKIFGLYNASQSLFNYGDLISSKHFYVYDGTLYIKPAPTTSGTDNISLKYYKYPTLPTVDASVLAIPDEFSTMLDAFAYGRMSQIDSQRGDASDGFGEFDELLKEMLKEHNRRRMFNKSIRPIHPMYLID